MQFALQDFSKEDKLKQVRATVKGLYTLSEDDRTFFSDLHLRIERRPNPKEKKLE